ncbi:hypothetical protein ACV367_33585, partial [Pseudomonas aeruginosa]
LDQKIADARNNMVKAQKKSDADLEILQINEQGRLKKQARLRLEAALLVDLKYLQVRVGFLLCLHHVVAGVGDLLVEA